MGSQGEYATENFQITSGLEQTSEEELINNLSEPKMPGSRHKFPACALLSSVWIIDSAG